jgi:hypothetical protein
MLAPNLSFYLVPSRLKLAAIFVSLSVAFIDIVEYGLV